jgi:uracil-DNA glycosylase family 4
MSTNGQPVPLHDPPTLQALLDEIRAYVEYQQSTGMDAFPRRTATTTTIPATAVAERDTADRSPQPPRGTASGQPMTSLPPTKVPAALGDFFVATDVRQAHTLDELRAEIGDCQRCKLCRGRTNIVFGVGNPQASLMFVGEGPGRDEDLKAEPFVGRAGQLLTEIITKGMKRRREDVYIANVVKCRPPENRNPEPDEIAACQPFLLRQIELIQPQVIVALGAFAAQTLLASRVPISRLRGQWFEYQGIKLMPTLHPAYLLRNPNDKRLVWEDIKLVMRELESHA